MKPSNSFWNVKNSEFKDDYVAMETVLVGSEGIPTIRQSYLLLHHALPA